MTKSYEVNIKLKDGSIIYFDTFISEYWANYNIALAHCTPDSYYKQPRFDDSEWIITERTEGV